MLRVIVTVSANAKKAEIVELAGPTNLRVKIDAPAKENKANIRLLELLANHFHVPFSAVRFVSGLTAKHKVVDIG